MHPYLMDPQFSGTPPAQNGAYPVEGQFAPRDGEDPRQAVASFAQGHMQPGSISQNGQQPWPAQQFPPYPNSMQHPYPPNQPHPAWQQQSQHTRRPSEEAHGPPRWAHQADEFTMMNGMPNYAPPEYMWHQMQHAMAAAAMQQYPSAAPGRTWQQLAALAKTSPAVDYALVEALRARTDLPRTARVAIESLHGVNGFPADAWKDYYLEFQDRIDAQLHGTGKKGLNGTHPNTKATTPVDLKVKTESRSRAPAAAGGKSATVKRPKVVVPSPSVSSESSESESESDASPAVRSKRKRPASPKNKIRIKREASTPTLSKPPAAPSGSAPPARRATFNSLVSQLDAPPEDWNIPVPSRSPTPPNMETIIPADRGKRQANKFTDQDRQYVIKFLTYELHKDPDASKGELADKIGDKAPHHPARSWQSYFNRDDLIDKIRNLVPSSDEDAEGSTED